MNQPGKRCDPETVSARCGEDDTKYYSSVRRKAVPSEQADTARLVDAMKSSRLCLPVIKGRLRPEFALQLLFLLQVGVLHPQLARGLVAKQAASPAPEGRAIHGVVKSGNMPIPGAGVSAVNAATKEQVNTWTAVDGSYWLRLPADGRYTVRAQMTAFADGTQEVVLDAT